MNDRKAELTRRVIELAAEQVGMDPSAIAPASHFQNDLNFDSLDRVEFAMSLEDEFEMSVPDEDAEKLDTVERVVEYILAHSKDGVSA